MPLRSHLWACWPARSWIGTVDCDAIRGRLGVLVGPHTWCGESSPCHCDHAAGYGSLPRFRPGIPPQRLDVLVGPHTWCGPSSHATAITLLGMVATAISSEDPSSGCLRSPREGRRTQRARAATDHVGERCVKRRRLDQPAASESAAARSSAAGQPALRRCWVEASRRNAARAPVATPRVSRTERGQLPARPAGGRRERSRGQQRADAARADATQDGRQWRRCVHRAVSVNRRRHGRSAASGKAAAQTSTAV